VSNSKKTKATKTKPKRTHYPRARRQYDPDDAPLRMPPRRRDWIKGTYQVGVFVRTPTGSTLMMVTMKPALEITVELAMLAMAASSGETREARRSRVKAALDEHGKHVDGVPQGGWIDDDGIDAIIAAVLGTRKP